MSNAAISGFSGLDLRRLRENSDPRSARRAVNLDLTLGREFKARDGLRHLMSLHPQSVGLYAIGGTLRAAIPGGQGYPINAVGPVPIKYDQLGLGTGYFTSVMVSTNNTVEVRIEGGVWPTGMAGRTLTIDGTVYTVDSALGTTATLTAAVTSLPGLYAFTLSGTGATASRSVSIANTEDRAYLTGGVWPSNMDGQAFSITRNGFTARVTARVSDTEIRLDTSLASGSVTNVEFQVSGLALDYPDDTLTRVVAVEAIGASASFGVYPYLVIERWASAADHARGLVYEHHWITQEPPDGNSALATQVQLPFSPGGALLQVSGKLWATDDVNGVVRFSSTANGPRDWTTAEDAGYVPVLSHTVGDRRIQGLGIYDDKLAVIFQDAVQLWATDPQPTNITLTRVINGPGTDQPNSVVNVLGDLFYFTRGGFRSMHMATVTGQIQEQDDIGGAIDSLTADETRPVAVALWSQSRGQYLCAFGSTVYAFRYSPKSKVQGWTTWELGHTVDAIVDLHGKTYIRSGDELYVLEKDYADGSTWELVLNDFTAKNPANRKRLDFMEVLQRGTCQVRTYLEPDSDTYYLDGPTLVGTTIVADRVFVGAMARTFGFRFTGTGPWTLSALQLTYLNMPW